MPTPDPNEKMENLLRAYAKKRREEAGASFELPPDVRARLHDEVRRALGQPAAQPRRAWKLWPRGWFWLAPVGGVAAVVVVLLTLRESPSKIDMPAGVAKTTNADVFAGTTTAVTPAPSAAPVPALPASAPIPVAPPVSMVVAAASVASPVTDSDGPVRMTNRMLADNQTTPLNDRFANESTLAAGIQPGGQVSGNANYVVATNSPQPVNNSNALAVAATAESATRSIGGGQRGGRAGAGGGGGGGFGGGGGLGGRRRAAEGSAATMSNTAAAPVAAVSGQMELAARPSAPPGHAADAPVKLDRTKAELSPADAVLTNFQIERIGAIVRIVDADGSVYVGQIAAAAGKKVPDGSASDLAKDVSQQQVAANRAQNPAFANNGAAQNLDNIAVNNISEAPPGARNNAVAQSPGQIGNIYSSVPGGPPPPGTGTTFDFQASGLNRKLNQNVTILGTCVISPLAQALGLNGNLLSVQDKGIANADKVTQKAAPASQQQNMIDNSGNAYRNAQNAAPLLQGWRVTGQVQVGPSNHFELDAATIRR